MPHQCVHCGEVYPAGSKELLTGCKTCNGRFFFYVRDGQLKKITETPLEMPQEDKDRIEKDIRELAGITNEETPVILDVESIRVVGPGKFEIDLVNVFNRKRPLIYRIEEGKYLIDLASTLSKNIKEIKEIRNPDD